jgi:hypothetical protein
MTLVSFLCPGFLSLSLYLFRHVSFASFVSPLPAAGSGRSAVSSSFFESAAIFSFKRYSKPHDQFIRNQNRVKESSSLFSLTVPASSTALSAAFSMALSYLKTYTSQSHVTILLMLILLLAQNIYLTQLERPSDQDQRPESSDRPEDRKRCECYPPQMTKREMVNFG